MSEIDRCLTVVEELETKLSLSNRLNLILQEEKDDLKASNNVLSGNFVELNKKFRKLGQENKELKTNLERYILREDN